MPKVIVREYDNTKAGNGLYTNFTVLVPGFVNSSATGVFDENNVCEFTNKDDFVAKVGKCAAQPLGARPGVAVSFSSKTPRTGANGGWPKAIELTQEETQQEATVPAAYLTVKASIDSATETLCYAIANTDGVGHFADETYKYVPVSRLIAESDDPENDSGWRANYLYAVIDNANPGVDPVSGVLQYGNQIAYELLSLGYTVLYKKISESDTSDSNNLEKSAFWAPLKDKSLYDFRYIVTGMMADNGEANKQIIDLARFVNSTPDDTGRGDCTALVDIDENTFKGKSQTAAIPGIQEEASGYTDSDKYAAYFAPTFTINRKLDADYNNNTFPASFYYLACAAKAAEHYNEWYAIAGYTRGVSNFDIASVGCVFGEEAVQALQPRYNTRANNAGTSKAVNIIVRIKGNYYLWGNRTAEKLGTKDSEDGDLKASHFLNIRQLCTSIKKQVYITCRKYTFDPNSDLLWVRFCNDIRPLLEKMKGDQGITDYKFIKVKTNQKAILKAKIRIVPIEAVEDFDISLTLEDSIAGVVAGVEE